VVAAREKSPSKNGLLCAVEHRLIAVCVEPETAADRNARIAEMLDHRLDWQAFIEASRVQGVAALCYSRLSALGAGAVPSEALALRADAMSIAARNLQLAAKLAEIAAEADRSGIALVPYKGPVLAEMAYGNPGLRAFVDLDFILPQRELRAAWKLLEGLGYLARNPALARAGAPIPGEYVFRQGKSGVQVELHTELTLRHFPSPPDLAPLLAAREPVTLVGRSVLTFSREDTLTLLAVHGAKDFWAQLLWVCDIAWLVAAPGFNWPTALARADKMRCRRMVNVALLLSSELLEAGIPAPAMAAAQADRVARAQARWLIERIFAPRPISPFEQLRYRIRMIDGFMPGIRYAVRLATTPAADDWNAIPLSGRFGFAYALLRPLRLLRK
jgi:hypothetical protein